MHKCQAQKTNSKLTAAVLWPAMAELKGAPQAIIGFTSHIAENDTAKATEKTNYGYRSPQVS